jgi:hypothetical protein
MASCLLITPSPFPPFATGHAHLALDQERIACEILESNHYFTAAWGWASASARLPW